VIVKQNDNVAQGDIVAGNKHVTNNIINQTQIDELHALYQKLKNSEGGDPSDGRFCEQLEHYLSAKTDGDVRGLEEKLSSSDRIDQLDAAVRMKERATKSIMRHQTSRTAQRIYTILLDELHTSFILMVAPLIQAGADRAAVDYQIQDVVDKLKGWLGENFLELTVKDLLGLLYFLGGNCHIRWDKC
jgi:hypothetical protein